MPPFGRFVTEVLIFRSSRLQMFFKIGVFKKDLHFYQKGAPTQVFSCEYCKISRTAFLQNTSGGCSWIFAADSAESGIYCWQSHRFLLRTPLKAGVKLQKQPLELFCKNGVFGNFANFTGKHLCWNLFLMQLQAFRPVSLLKRDSYTDFFQWNLRNF